MTLYKTCQKVCVQNPRVQERRGYRQDPKSPARGGGETQAVAGHDPRVVVQLAKDLGETVDLAIFGHNKAVVVDQISGTHPLLAVSEVGSSLPLHNSASGKVLLASLPIPELQKLRRHLQLPATTPNTITDWNRLDREIEQVRKQRVAFDREEYLSGICAVAIPRRGPGGGIAAVSLPAPTERFKMTERILTETLMERCQALQRRLGGRDANFPAAD